ncbi:MAG: glycosyltransferase family 2 protein, partial [Treponema sp.]|nr:glycosyltransferase family 2 protein [Treponema sp.]
MKTSKPILYLIVPCYNEAQVLPETHILFLNELELLIKKGKISDNSRIMFLDNASTDDTWNLIKKFAKEDCHFIGAKQSRNFGHQGNVLAGLMEAKDKCDITISIDCDGQDDITSIEDMVDAYHNGSEVVYGVRNSRKKDTFLKRFTAQSFYKLLKKMGADIVYNHADYRLISSRVLKEFANFKEVNLFLRGLVPLVGFKSSCVYYERNERIAGKSHYGISSLFTLAFDGITSLSTEPIKLITRFGIFISFISFLGVIWAIVS